MCEVKKRKLFRNNEFLIYNIFIMSSEVKNYILKKRGLLSSDTLYFIMDLYLPIIGHDASFLYLFFMNQIQKNEVKGDYESLISKTLFSKQDFLLAKQNLESIGLLNTYEKSEDQSLLFILNDPETPKNFFNNLLLKGLFISSSSEESYKEVLKRYSAEITTKGYKDVGATFNDSYQLEFDYEKVEENGKVELKGRSKNALKDNFSEVKLINYLCKNYQLTPICLSDEEVKNIHRVASLHGIDELSVGQLCGSCINLLNKVGSKIDIEKLRKLAQIYVKNFDVSQMNKKTKKKETLINSESDVAKRLNIYESTSPIMFLRNKQNGIEPVASDKAILDMLAFEMSFSDGMINALIDYVLRVNNGELNKNYISKIASTLIRKGAYDTLSVLEILEGKNAHNSGSAKVNFNKSTLSSNANLTPSTLDEDDDVIDASKYDDDEGDYDII